ncbi:MAG TPA: lipopolysaccharide biosynthesis protein [Aliidongia sp.]|nr:lipopolysaccharide biosynthesis protein [Aliidongia sp.]
MTISRQKAAKSLVWTSLESGGLSGLSFLTLIVLSHFLAPTEFGVASLALSVVQILNIPVEMLFHDALVQRKTIEDRHFDTAFTVSLGIGIVLALGCWAGADAFARWVGEPSAASVLRWMSLSLPAMGMGSAIMARLRREMQFRPLALRSLGGRLVGALTAVILAILGAGVWSLVAQQVLMVGLATVILWACADRWPRLSVSRTAFTDLFGFGLRATSVMATFFAFQRIFILLVGNFLGSEVVGYLNMAFRTVDMLRDVLAGAVSQLLLPVFARLQDDRPAFIRAYGNAVEYTCAIAFPIFLGLFATAPELVPAVLGVAWQSAVPFVEALALATIPFYCRMFAAPAMSALGKPHYPLVSSLVGLGVMIVGMTAVGRNSALLAIAIWVGRLAVSTPIDIWMLRRLSGMTLKEQFTGLPRLIIIGAAMVAAVELIRPALQPWALSITVQLGILVLAGAAVYGGGMLVFNRSLTVRLIDFVQSARKPHGPAVVLTTRTDGAAL